MSVVVDWTGGPGMEERYLPSTGYAFDSAVARGRGNTTRGPTDIVVHAMAEFIEVGRRPVPAWAFFHEQGLSAHTLILPSGIEMRLVPTDEVAWHCSAGRMNWKALGIEILLPGVHTYPSFVRELDAPDWAGNWRQFDAAAGVVVRWMKEFGIPAERVHRHSDLDPRKCDPGDGFPWAEFKLALGEEAG